MARPELSPDLHALKGTEPQPRKPNVIPLALLAGRPKCPRTLSKAARMEWLAALKLLESRGTLDPGAGPTLELYATTKARWLECMEDLNRRGLQIEITKATSKGDLYTITADNPMLKIAQDCEAQLMQLTKTIGIAPDAREKVRKVKPVARASAVPAWLASRQAREQADGHDGTES
jgi:P27 family predicted phage terminase small subunit